MKSLRWLRESIRFPFGGGGRVNFHGRDLVGAEARRRTRSVLSAVFQGLNEAQLWPLDGGQTEYIENAHLLLHHRQHHQLNQENALVCDNGIKMICYQRGV